MIRHAFLRESHMYSTRIRKAFAILAIVLGICALPAIAEESVQVIDPLSVTQAVLDAINSGDADLATSYFAVDGQLITSIGQPRGLKRIHAFLVASLIPLKNHFEVKTLAADGSNVAGSCDLSTLDGNYTGLKILSVVQEGKIKSLMIGSGS